MVRVRAGGRIIVTAAAVVGLIAAGGATRIDRAEAHAAAVPGAAQLVGEANGGLFVGVVAERRRAAAFVTDGAQLGVFFTGAVRERTATLADGRGNTLSLELASSSASGQLRLVNRAPASLRLVAAGGTAGWFARARRVVVDARLKEELTAWIRLRDGRVRGIRRVENPLGAPAFSPAPASLAGSTRVLPEALFLRCPRATPACGLPAAAKSVPAASTLRVVANPPSVRLTETRLRTLARAARAKTLAGLREAGFFFPDSTVRRLAAEWLAKLRATTRVMATSAALRSALVAGRYEDISRHQGEFEDAVVQGGLTLPQTLRDRLTTTRRGLPPIQGLPRPVANPQTAIVLQPGDFAQTEERTSEGDFASFPSERMWLVPTPQPGSKTYFVRASAGVNSRAELSTMLVAPFDVPENIRQVEIQVDGWSAANEDAEVPCLPPPLFTSLGFPHASAMMAINAERVAADGSTTIVAQADDWVMTLFSRCSLIPVPDPPALTASWPRTLRFFPPAGGGRYQLQFWLDARASVTGLGFATGQAYLELNRATIRLRR